MASRTTGLSQQLLDASEPSDVAKVLLDELAEAFELDLANMALIEDGGLAAVIVAAREGGRDNLGLVGKRDRARPRAVRDQRAPSARAGRSRSTTPSTPRSSTSV